MSAEQRNAERKAELEASRARRNAIREKFPYTAPITPNLTTMPIGSLTPSREVVDPDKILEELGIIQSTSLPTSSPISSSQQKHQLPTNVLLQICQQPSATISVPPKELITYSKAVQTIESGEIDQTASFIQYDPLEPDDVFQQSFMSMSLASASELKGTRSLKQQNKQLKDMCQITI